jgi:transposase
MKLFGWKNCCQQLEAENRQLRERNAVLEQRLAEAQEKNTRLVQSLTQAQEENTRLAQSLAAAKKNSGNSSKPPSSDIVKPPKKRRGKKGKRRIGGQKGHPKHERAPFPPDQVHERMPHRLHQCPINPAHRIVPAEDRQRVLQQIELVEQPFKVTEHIGYGIWCEDCQCYHDAPWPKELIAAGLFGPRLTTLTTYLKAKLRGSYSGARDFLEDVVGVKVSRGYVAKLLRKAGKAFEQPVQELFRLLPLQPEVNVDETGHKENGQRYWTWCFRTPGFVAFKIEPSRGTEVLMRILGEGFKGILGCDYYAAYRKYARQCDVLVQFCLAHLIRDVKYLCDFPDRHVQAYGRGLIEGLKALFGALHRKDQLSASAFKEQIEAARERIWEAAMEPQAFPQRFGGPHPHRLIANMVKRFTRHGEAYFQFITTPQIDPTNNCGERAIRFIVMDRHVTQGTRSLRGREICERLWTVMATCSAQKRSAFKWMCEAITAHFKGEAIPSLLLDSS